MPDSNYTTTPPSATEMQILAMGDKVNDICKNVEKLSQRMEDIPLKLDRLSTSIETLSRESAENRSALERTRNNFEQDLDRAKHELGTEIEKIKGEIATKEKDLNETLKPLIKSETKVTTIFAIVAGVGIFTLTVIGTTWNAMDTRVDSNTSRLTTLEQKQEMTAKQADALQAKQSEIDKAQDDLQMDFYKRGTSDEK